MLTEGTNHKMTIAGALLKYLELEGVNKLFGIPGTSMKHLLQGLKNHQDIDYVICRQETGAAFMAEGYFRVTGKLGVILVTSGAGSTNALTGMVTAQHSNSALLLISAEPTAEDYGKGYLQDIVDNTHNVNTIYRSACQYSVPIHSPKHFSTLFTQALRDALSIPCRAAHIALPDKIAGSDLEEDVPFPTQPANYRAIPQSSSPHQVQQAFDYLIKAKQPLIFLGNGCRLALRDGERLAKFTSFVEKLAIPVMTTPDGKGIFPESHPLSLRNYGIAACDWPKVYMESSDYDALMVLGSSLDGYATQVGWQAWNNRLIPNGPIVQVDLDQRTIGKAFPIDLGIVAEVSAAIDYLCELSASASPEQASIEQRQSLVAHIKKTRSPFADALKYNDQSSPILPQALMKCINDSQQLRQGGHIFIDSGNCLGWTLHYLEIEPPVQFHNASPVSPMGFATAGVVGGKIGDPEKTCVAITGDGAFLMQGNEISTAAENRVGAIWVVLYDNDLNTISQYMQEFSTDDSPWQGYYKLGKPDLVKFAEGLGADAYSVYNPQEMKQVFAQAIESANTKHKPQVIVAFINTQEVPPWHTD